MPIGTSKGAGGGKNVFTMINSDKRKQISLHTHTRFNEVLHHMDGEGFHWQQMEAVGSSSWKCNSELNLREGD